MQRREEARAALKRRNDVFSKIVELGYLDGVSLDIDHSDVLVKLLDAGEWLDARTFRQVCSSYSVVNVKH